MTPIALKPDAREHEVAVELMPQGDRAGVLKITTPRYKDGEEVGSDAAHYFFGPEPGGFWISRFGTDDGTGEAYHVEVAGDGPVKCGCNDCHYRRRVCKHMAAVVEVLRKTAE